ncbi:MAG: FAD-dependent oxidoreductase [bacterium]|nr:FAD-dependent oxidoreductase [bacterium]
MTVPGAATSDVVVVGAGVAGCACAYYLSRAGLKVTVLEQHAIASGASTHATGSFSLLSTDFNSPAYLRLGVESYRLTRDLIPELEESSGVETLYQRRPALRLALDEDEERLIRSTLEWQAQQLTLEWVTGESILAEDRRVNPEARGGVLEPEGAQIDSGRFTLALAMGAERRGAEIVLRRATGLVTEGDRLTGITHAGGRVSAPAVVLAMGPWAAEAQTWGDFRIPVTMLKGERLMLRLPGPPLPWLISTPRRGHMISRQDGLLSVGSTAGRDLDVKSRYLVSESDPVEEQSRPTEGALVELIERASDILPDAIQEAVLVEQLAGVRPLTPDRMAMIGPIPGLRGAYLATGHGTKGIHLAAVTGFAITRMLLDAVESQPAEYASVDPARLAIAAPPFAADDRSLPDD